MSTKQFRMLHRRVGVAIALLAIWLAASGIALNHSELLNLAERPIGPVLAEKLYGLKSAEIESGYQVGDDWLTVVENQLFLNSQAVGSGFDSLRGGIRFNISEFPMLLAAGKSSITAITENGELIERIYTADLPVDEVLAVITLKGLPAIYDPQGRCFRAENIDLIRWRACPPPAVFEPGLLVASQLTPLPERYRLGILDQLGGAKISWQQLLLDLHSGKAVGSIGRAVIDLSGVLLIFLSLTGLWIASRRWRR